MSAPTDIQKPLPPLGEFAIGWRDVERRDANGHVHFDQIPLTLEDALHPQLGDHVVRGTAHNRDCHFLWDVFRRSVAQDPSAVVYHNVGIYWEDDCLRHHAPDIAVVSGVQNPEHDRDGFHCAREGTRPRLLLEVTSPNTRDNDVVAKVGAYHRAKVPYYILVDAHELDHEPRTLRIIGYRYEAAAWSLMPLDDQGRLWLEEFGFWLGSKDGRVACFHKDGRALNDYVSLAAELEAIRAQTGEIEAQTARIEAQTASDIQACLKAEAQIARDIQARAEAEARVLVLEKKIRAAEEELRRLRGAR